MAKKSYALRNRRGYTRSRAETAFVQLLLDVLRTVNDAISTATGPVSWSWGTGSTLADRGTGSRLLDAWPNMIPASLRPPPVVLGLVFPGYSRTDPHRATDRSMRITRHPGWPTPVLPHWVWGREDYEEDRTTYHNLSWGTIQ